MKTKCSGLRKHDKIAVLGGNMSLIPKQYTRLNAGLAIILLVMIFSCEFWLGEKC